MGIQKSSITLKISTQTMTKFQHTTISSTYIVDDLS